MEQNSKNRIVAIDIIRISLMIIIFCFHSYIHINCTYGIITTFFAKGSLVMGTFFIISGFALLYTNYKKDMNSIHEIKRFYIKRIIGIYPTYIFIVVFFFLFNNTITLLNKCMIIPMDVMMLQSIVDGSFNTLHHGGTCFISCLFICYLLTPFFIEILKQLETKKILKLGVSIYLICAYIPFIVRVMGYRSVYSNVIYRSLQFFIGLIIAAIYIKQNSKEIKIYKKLAYIILFVSTIILLVVQNNIDNNFQTNEHYSFLIMLISIALIYIASFAEFKKSWLQKIVNSKLIKYANEIAYEFFLAQFFCFQVTTKIVMLFPVCNRNIIKMLISLIICSIIAIMLHEFITKPCKKLFNKLIDKHYLNNN